MLHEHHVQKNRAAQRSTRRRVACSNNPLLLREICSIKCDEPPTLLRVDEYLVYSVELEANGHHEISSWDAVLV